jgi:hypothetical protein
VTSNESVRRIDALLRRIARTGLPSAFFDNCESTSLGARPQSALDATEWATVLQRCAANRIVGLLAASIEHGDLVVTDEQRRDMLERHREQLSKCLAIERQLVRTASLLDDAGIEIRVLKGPAVAHLDYPDPAMRSFTDVDVLVRSSQLDEAVALLLDLGLERRFRQVRPGFDARFSKGIEFFNGIDPEIDLHRTFVMGSYGLRIDLDDLWTTCEPLQLGGRELVALDRDVRFLHACYHVALGGVDVRLAQLRDIPQLLAATEHPVDVDLCFDLLDSWGGEAVVARAVALAWDRLGLAPTELSEWARSHRLTSRDVRDLRSYLDPEMGYAARCLTALTAIPGLRQKSAFAWGLAFPSSEYGAGTHTDRRQRWAKVARDLRRIVIPPRDRDVAT